MDDFRDRVEEMLVKAVEEKNRHVGLAKEFRQKAESEEQMASAADGRIRVWFNALKDLGGNGVALDAWLDAHPIGVQGDSEPEASSNGHEPLLTADLNKTHQLLAAIYSSELEWVSRDDMLSQMRAKGITYSNDDLYRNLSTQVKRGRLEKQDGRYRLTDAGLEVVNEIANA